MVERIRLVGPNEAWHKELKIKPDWDGLLVGSTYKVLDGTYFLDDIGRLRNLDAWHNLIEQVEEDCAAPAKEKPTTAELKIPTPPDKQADRFNSGKTQLSYILDAGVAMAGMCKVFEFGAKKYDRGNWKKGLPVGEVMDSMLRHLMAYSSGEVLDPESGLPHVDHITCNAVFLATFGERDGKQAQG